MKSIYNNIYINKPCLIEIKHGTIYLYLNGKKYYFSNVKPKFDINEQYYNNLQLSKVNIFYSREYNPVSKTFFERLELTGDDTFWVGNNTEVHIKKLFFSDNLFKQMKKFLGE